MSANGSASGLAFALDLLVIAPYHPGLGDRGPNDGSIEGGHGCKYYWVY